jgi:hypothetical protein
MNELDFIPVKKSIGWFYSSLEIQKPDNWSGKAK